MTKHSLMASGLLVGVCWFCLSLPVRAAPVSPEDLEDWIANLVTGSETAKRQAALAIEMAGEDAAACVPALLDRLKDGAETQEVKWAVVRALRKMGPRAEPAVEYLVESITGSDGERDTEQIFLLELLGQDLRSAADALAGLLSHESPAVRRVAAMSVEGTCADPEVVVPALEAILLKDGLEARRAAAKALGTYGPGALPALGSLRSAVLGADHPLKIEAALAIARIGPAAAAALLDVARAQEGARPLARNVLDYTAWALGGGEAGIALRGLLDAFQRGDNPYLCLDLLASMGGVARDAAPVLVGSAKSSSRILRRSVIRTIGAISSGDEVSLEALRGALGDPDDSVRWTAVVALLRFAMDRPEVLRWLVGSLEDPSRRVVHEVLQGLGDMGGAAAPAVPKLGELLRAVDPPQPVLQALAKIGSKEAVLLLVRALDETRQADLIIELLTGLGPRAKAAESALEEMARDAGEDEEIRSAAARALRSIRGE